MKTLLLTIISVAVLLSVMLSAWALYERSNMKIEIAALTKDVQDMEAEIKTLKSNPSQAARPSAPAEQPVVEKVVSIDDDPMKGDKDAPITIIEFSDYECPFCKRSHDNVMTKIDEEYVKTGKVRVVFRDFPLGFHKNAIPAALAANCGGEQGKYWEVHEFLFKNPKKLTPDDVLASADEIGLDKAKFQACVNNKDNEKEITADMEAGKEYGVRGTPSYFIGRTTDGDEITGVFVAGAQPYSVFKKHIDEKLEEAN
ncbi:MAG: thioredoxin domain-containing protein [Thermodesulfobacteriota bacterium]